MNFAVSSLYSLSKFNSRKRLKMGSLCAVYAAKSTTLIALRKLHLRGSKIDVFAHPQFSIP